MTKEEKIICKQFLNDADKTHSCNEYKLLMALLEQELILDKIRAEIEQDAFKDVNDSKFIFVNHVNQIFDKYKGESEDKK